MNDMSAKYFVISPDFWPSINALHENERFPGIYRLHATGSDGSFLPISRLLGVDPNGVLYIGTSVVVQDRAASLKKSICAAYKKVDPQTYGDQTFIDVGSHQTGKKIVRLPKFVAKFPLSTLCLTVEKYKGNDNDLETTSSGHFSLEEKLLREYKNEYGEKPALNS
jgi:hypothetical protein